jgi:hypothetical protein
MSGVDGRNGANRDPWLGCDSVDIKVSTDNKESRITPTNDSSGHDDARKVERVESEESRLAA